MPTPRRTRAVAGFFSVYVLACRRSRRLLLLCLSLASPLAVAASLTPLGHLPGGYSFSSAADVSDDGTVVVGSATNASGHSEAIRWTRADGMIGLGFLGGANSSYAEAVSGNGNTIVGRTGAEAFRWTMAGGMVGLGGLSGGNSFVASGATGVSADGEVVVGYGRRSLEPTEAFRWTAAGDIVAIGIASGNTTGRATAVSDDGNVVVGSGLHTAADEAAFRWTGSEGFTGLGFLPGGYSSSATGTSGDGSVVVGASSNATPLGTEAFLWTVNGGMRGLGTFTGSFGSVAWDVSNDGSIVVGFDTLGGRTAFVWTETGGMQSLLTVLATNGATGLTGWSLREAKAISADGRWVVGTGTNPLGSDEAFLADLSPVPIPAVGWLLVPALGAVGFTGRRRKPKGRC